MIPEGFLEEALCAKVTLLSWQHFGVGWAPVRTVTQCPGRGSLVVLTAAALRGPGRGREAGPPEEAGFLSGQLSHVFWATSDFIIFNSHVLNTCDVESAGFSMGSRPNFLFILQPDFF